jgi:hypothetical protein
LVIDDDEGAAAGGRIVDDDEGAAAGARIVDDGAAGGAVFIADDGGGGAGGRILEDGGAPPVFPPLPAAGTVTLCPQRIHFPCCPASES